MRKQMVIQTHSFSAGAAETVITKKFAGVFIPMLIDIIEMKPMKSPIIDDCHTV